MSDDFFAAPQFKADESLITLKRQLRDLRLAERGNAFEQRGKRVVELVVEGGAIQARLARRLTITPEWDRFTVKSAPEQRKLLENALRDFRLSKGGVEIELSQDRPAIPDILAGQDLQTFHQSFGLPAAMGFD